MSKFSELLLASNNAHKADEIKAILAHTGTKIYTLKEKGIEIEIIEDAKTLEGNALKKAKGVFETAGIPVVSDDTGLFVEALRGKPGVFSARYAGENATYKDNCKKVVSELKAFGLDYSPAYFKTVICLYTSRGEYHIFEGIRNGQIITEMRGEKGFGYDPLFIPRGYNKTFAEMSPEEKNKISHRGRALEELRKFLI